MNGAEKKTAEDKKGSISVCTCGERGIDTSLPALQLAKENVALNDLNLRRISFLRQDATEFMKAAVSRNESWDIVILDPPKLAPRKKVLKSASGMYRNLNYLAIQLTKRGGLLMTCSCSGAMTQSGILWSYDPKWNVLQHSSGMLIFFLIQEQAGRSIRLHWSF